MEQTKYFKEDKENGVFSASGGVYYKIPGTEQLLYKVKSIEEKIIQWYKQNHYSQGDSYYAYITKKGKWGVMHSNDYPMQHGDGCSHVLTEEEFMDATEQLYAEKKL